MDKTYANEQVSQYINEHIVDDKGNKVAKTYLKGFILGKGAFAKVYKVTCVETSQVFAGKFIVKSDLVKVRAKQKLMSEIKIHRMLKHQNIVQFCRYFEDEEFLYILMEYCKNQTLSDLIRRRKRITEIEAQCYSIQLLKGIQYLHSHRVIHRDLKLANIFLDENMEVKIGDFGLAAKLEFDGERKRTICGTPNYMAPEILNGKYGHSYECDIWSFGVILYTLIVGKPPFETGDVKKTYQRIKMTAYRFPEDLTISIEAKMLISSILILDYTKRPNINDILSSDFLNKNPIPALLPTCVLAVPPSQGYRNQFENRGRSQQKDGSIVRSSTHENLSHNSSLPTTERPHSKDPKQPLYCETRCIIKITSYNKIQTIGPKVWITKWVDYSHKYGVGYFLSNNWVGVVFNDKSKIVSNLTGERILYMDNKKNGEEVMRFSIHDFPKELYKKVMLLQLFKKYLQVDSINDELKIENQFIVKNWIRTPHSTLFRTNDKTIQVFFNDKSELIVMNLTKIVVYIDKSGKTSSSSILKAIESGSKDLVKRLRYSKEVLTKVVKDLN